MDISQIARKLHLSESNDLIRKAAELRRLCDVHFDSSIIGIGEICKAIICVEIAASRLQLIFDRKAAVKLSGLSEKAYGGNFNVLQNTIGIKTKLDVRELGIQFGCIRLIPLVQKGLSLFKDRFLAALPPSRRASADVTRPVFTAVAFYLCARRHKLKIDRLQLIDVCGIPEAEFNSISITMKNLCHDVFGITKERDSSEIKGNKDHLHALPDKRKFEDVVCSIVDGIERSSHKKKCKKQEKLDHEECKSSILSSEEFSKEHVEIAK